MCVTIKPLSLLCSHVGKDVIAQESKRSIYIAEISLSGVTWPMYRLCIDLQHYCMETELISFVTYNDVTSERRCLDFNFSRVEPALVFSTNWPAILGTRRRRRPLL